MVDENPGEICDADELHDPLSRGFCVVFTIEELLLMTQICNTATLPVTIRNRKKKSLLF